MIPEEVFLKLEMMEKEAAYNEARIIKFREGITAHANKLISEIYEPELMAMESKGFEYLRERLGRSTYNLAEEVFKIVYMKQDKNGWE